MALDTFVSVARWLLIAGLAIPLMGAAAEKPPPWDPVIDPTEFVSEVDNPYFPLPEGRILRYRAETSSGVETLEFQVTRRTRLVDRVKTTVVVERHALEGDIVEISENWFAQDGEGNVWYFGEFSQNYEDGEPTDTNGSWEAGVDGALPGIIMKAHPRPGDTYYQEFAPGVAEDQAQVVSLGRTITVPYGIFQDVLLTKEWTDLEPGSVEQKSYAPGIGLILDRKGGERLELVGVEE